MSWRGNLRHALAYVVAVVAGFSLAYLIVAFIVFPSGVVPRDAKVPNVVGMDYDAAATRLAQVGFKAERGEERFHATAPRLTVLEQSPAAGASDLAGAKVTLTVSKGQQMGRVPSVNGLSREDAERAIEDAGFAVGEISEQPSQSPRGAVLGTRPSGGTQMPMPSPVALVVSAGPTVVTTPDVVGRNFAQAQLLLQQVGLTLGDVSTEGTTSAEPTATVLSQSPAAGSQVARGARIDLRLGGTQ